VLLPPWIFVHGTNMVDKGLKVLFSVFFCYFLVFFPLPTPLSLTQKHNGQCYDYIESNLTKKEGVCTGYNS